MKNIYLIISLVLIFNACKSQNNKKMEYFDIKKFEQYRFTPYENTAEYNKEDGTFVYMEDNGEEGYDMLETPPDPALYKFFKTFHKNTHLKTSEKRFKRGNVILGTVIEYDEYGKVTNATDYDKPYAYSWENVQTFCINHKIDISHFKTSINRDCRDNKCKWEIEGIGIYDEKKETFVFTLDGKTGEIILIKQFSGKKSGPNGVGTIGVYEIIYDKEQVKKKSSSVFRSHEGKNYTKVEWQAYEEKKYEEYCKRTGRTYTPISQELTHRQALDDKPDNKKSFLADDNEQGHENTPKKKKGFWDNLFG